MHPPACQVEKEECPESCQSSHVTQMDHGTGAHAQISSQEPGEEIWLNAHPSECLFLRLLSCWWKRMWYPTSLSLIKGERGPWK